jgi:hypothetical protein
MGLEVQASGPQTRLKSFPVFAAGHLPPGCKRRTTAIRLLSGRPLPRCREAKRSD